MQPPPKTFCGNANKSLFPFLFKKRKNAVEKGKEPCKLYASGYYKKYPARGFKSAEGIFPCPCGE